MRLGDLSSQHELCLPYEGCHLGGCILPGVHNEVFQLFNCGTAKPVCNLLFGRIAGKKLFNGFTHSVA